MTDPQPTKHHSTGAWSRLRSAWRAMTQAFKGSIPADDSWCKHGYGAGYCLDDPTCDHFDRGHDA